MKTLITYFGPGTVLALIIMGYFMLILEPPAFMGDKGKLIYSIEFGPREPFDPGKYDPTKDWAYPF